MVNVWVGFLIILRFQVPLNYEQLTILLQSLLSGLDWMMISKQNP